MIDLTPRPSTVIRSAAFVLRWLVRLLLALVLLLGLAWGTLQYFIVPRISDFRPRLEMMATSLLGVPVRVARITAYPGALAPSLELHGVQLLDAQGREALALPRVVAAMSVRSLLRLDFEQLYIEQPSMEIRRTADNRLLVAGLDLFSGTREPDAPFADWFFSQREFVIRGAMVRWVDEGRDAEPLALGQLDFVMRNSARHHDLRIDATPPPGWGGRFQVVGRFGRPLLSLHAGRWADWDGQAYAEFTRLDVSQLRRHIRLGEGMEIGQGRGALRAWADVARGEWVGGAADLALTDVTATLGPGLEPLDLPSVSGRLGGKRLAGGFQLYTEGLQFVTRDGIRWPGGNVSLTHSPADARRPAAGELRADRLDLAALSQIAGRLPLAAGAHAALLAHPVKGLVETVQARWQGPLDAPETYELRGRVSGLEVAAWTPPAATASTPAGTATVAPTAIPGLRGATVDVDLNQSGGKGTLVLARGALELPGVFEDPLIPFDRLSADAQWQLNGERIVVQKFSTRFANADAEGEFSGNWQTSDPARSAGRSRFPGLLDLKGQFSRADGTRVHRYLPLGISAEVRHYVRDAIGAGAVSDLSVRVRGDLHDLPFADPKLGEFRLAGKARNVTYAYVPRSLQRPEQPPWPVLADLNGELVFDRASLRVRGASSRVAGVEGLQINRVEAQIPDLVNAATVVVSLDARGPMTALLGIVNGSPIGEMTGKALAQASATGDAAVRVQLNLPLGALDKSKVQGSVTMAGNDVRIRPDTPMLGRARGQVTFNESGFAITGAQARMLGGEVRLEGGSRAPAAGVPAGAEPSVVLRAQGNLTAEGLQQAGELGFVSRFAQHATGGTSYSGVLGIHRGVPELLVSSNLQGLGLNLPAPFNKAADAALPLRFENKLLGEPVPPGPSGAARLQDQLQLDLGRTAAVTYVRDISGPEPRVLRGSIGVGLAAGESAPLPESGVAANINLANVNVDAWEAAFSKASGVALASQVVPGAPAPGASPALGYLPTVMAVRAGELTVGGRTFHKLVIGGGRDGLTWRANLSADELNGYVEYRQPAGGSAGRVHARLARLTVATGAATDVEALLDQQPAAIPALDIVVEDFELRGKKLGRVEVEAINRGGGAAPRDGGPREWRLNKFNVVVPEASFTATGNWVAVGPPAGDASAPRPLREGGERRRTVMNFKLDMADSGTLLARFGMKDVIRRGKGKIEGQVAWMGSPLSPDYPTLGGQFNLNVESGQFLKADPGMAKLLGVLSLQSLPRRMTLDFRDVFSDGFAFDFVRGDVSIAQGIASTNNLQMKGVNAAVLMDGRADIARETQDIRVVIVPEIDALTASLVATAINPVLGLGTVLAQLVLRQPLIQAATQEFHVDGTWTDPRITKVAKTPPATLPAPSSREGGGP